MGRKGLHVGIGVTDWGQNSHGPPGALLFQLIDFPSVHFVLSAAQSHYAVTPAPNAIAENALYWED